MGRTQTAFPVMPIAKTEQFLAVMDPSPGLLPELRRLHHREKDLLGARAVHLLSDNLLKLTDHPVTQRKI